MATSIYINDGANASETPFIDNVMQWNSTIYYDLTNKHLVKFSPFSTKAEKIITL